MPRVALIVIIIAIYSLRGTAQVFFAPEVVINTAGLSIGAARELTDLEIQLKDMLQSFSPDVYLAETPKQPIRIFLLLSVNAGDGSEFIANMELVMYRPIYGKVSESPVFIMNEKDVRFRFQREMNRGVLGRSLPEDPLQAMVYYYATLGLMYYYDSFSIYGGNPILEYLVKEKGQLEQVLTGNYPSMNKMKTSGSPERQLMELKSEWGEQFRELWYVYHRRGLDAEDQDKYGETLKMVLNGLKQIRDENRALGFISFFSDTKRGEIRSYLNETAGGLRGNEVKTLVNELFPSLLRSL